MTVLLTEPRCQVPPPSSVKTPGVWERGSCQGFNARFLEFFRIDDGNGYPGPVVRHARKVGRHGQFRHDLHGFRTGGGLGVFFFSRLGKRGLACECGKANGNSAHLKGFLRIKHGCGALRSVTRRTVGQPHRLVFWLARQARLQWRYRSGFTPVFPNLFPARLRASLRSVTLPTGASIQRFSCDDVSS